MCTVPDCHRSAIADHQYENSTWTNVQLKWFFLGCVFFMHILSGIHFGVYIQFWERHNTHSMTVHYLTGTSKNPFCPCLYIHSFIIILQQNNQPQLLEPFVFRPTHATDPAMRRFTQPSFNTSELQLQNFAGKLHAHFITCVLHLCILCTERSNIKGLGIITC